MGYRLVNVKAMMKPEHAQKVEQHNQKISVTISEITDPILGMFVLI